jgi:quercetin dioxygenase-like cupin family protein
VGKVDDTYHVHVDEVEPVPGLGPDQGWVGMTVQFLIDAGKGRSQHFVFGRARFAPGESTHEWHRHPNAEEFVFVQHGHGIVLDGDNEIAVGPGDVVFHEKGAWHGFRNTSATEEAVMIWGWGGATSKAEAGYELRRAQDAKP